jgi:ribosomal protein S18 acetylase RimI-like enzyme
MVNFRKAEITDAEGIAHLHASSWRRIYRGNFRDAFLDGDVFTERNKVWASRLGSPRHNQYVGVAESAGKLCGFVCMYGNEDAEWGSFIDNLHVDNEFHQQGIGTALMRHAGAWLEKEYPGQGVWLVVWEGNPAIKFYEALGGRNTGLVEEDNPGGGTGKYFRMVWESPSALVSKITDPE